MLPEGLPAPVDDGAADHLIGVAMPAVSLASTTGDALRVDAMPDSYARLIIYAHPWIGRPGEGPLVADWDLLPGARGCTPESCGFRDVEHVFYPVFPPDSHAADVLSWLRSHLTRSSR